MYKFFIPLIIILFSFSCSDPEINPNDMMPTKEGGSPKWLGESSSIPIKLPENKFFELMALTEDLAYENWPHGALQIRPCFSEYVSVAGFQKKHDKECVLYFYIWGSPAKKFLSVKHVTGNYDFEREEWILNLELNFAPVNNEQLQKLNTIIKLGIL